jgi:DNA-binding response OmpR family regulator
MARVFVVDGDSRYRRLLRAGLEEACHEVFEFARGARALQVIEADRPDAVLTRDHLLDAVWGEDCEADPRVVDNIVRHLGHELGIAADRVRKVRGTGYRLDPPTNLIAKPAESPP